MHEIFLSHKNMEVYFILYASGSLCISYEY